MKGMKKICLSLYCITLMAFCQGVSPVSAISEAQKEAIVSNCSQIHGDLAGLRRSDARARVYLGSYYETILTKFVIPMNMRLVENGLSTPELVANQNDLSSAKSAFTTNFVDYQRELETLSNMDCKAEPEAFYDKLEVVRKKRATVDTELQKMHAAALDQVKLVKGVRAKL